eukprot:Nk52_evm1s1427 gene=Nk52_evmTU1s1427
MLVRDQAGRLPDGARDVLETAAATADQVVVVVVPVQLVLHAASADGDAPQQIGIGEGVQHVVDRLAGYGPQALPDHLRDGFGIGMRMRLDRGQRGQSRSRHAQTRTPEGGGVIDARHGPTLA